MNNNRRKTLKVKKTNNEMRKVYGEMILPKGTILYHSSEHAFQMRKDKPMLFLTFHPSEWEGWSDEYITQFTLNRDASLFFMIGGFNKTRVEPLLNSIITPKVRNSSLKSTLNISNINVINNLAKQYDSNLKCYVQNLENEQFDGWVSTIEGKPYIEVALINEPSIYTASESKEFTKNWRNGNNSSGTFEQKNWGNLYQISSINNPVTLNINKRYETPINTYIEYGLQKIPYEFAFQILMKNAIINYHEYPFSQIEWVC
jgi:hypothetical protein